MLFTWDGVAATRFPSFRTAEMGVLVFSGLAPFFTGVDGGRVLSMYSGLTAGPKETRFERSPPNTAIKLK